ncbi:signal peptidase I [Tsukamurella sp. 1534]|uniref:signal peptidase I n=1 Tax=Tsukamurella sp. 1534 TaxID=1151061 RepID=UPI00031EB067|nr:signal peptidase I [Tsukamurella sp. 1534]
MPEQTNPQSAPDPDGSASSAAGPTGRPRGRHAASEAEPATAPRAGKKGKGAKAGKKTNWPLEIGAIVLVALVLSFLLQNFVGRQWYVPSESMEPTLIGCNGCTGDRIVTQKISYYGGDPQPGDVIVFKGPTASWDMEGRPSVRSENTVIRGIQEGLSYVGLQPPNENDLVKRVIATGGQKIECRNETGVTVDGRKITEPYLADVAKQVAQADACWGKPFGPISIPDGNVFVMGDNRTASADSRYHIDDELQGTVPKADIRGKVAAIIYPFDRWQRVRSINPQQG